MRKKDFIWLGICLITLSIFIAESHQLTLQKRETASLMMQVNNLTTKVINLEKKINVYESNVEKVNRVMSPYTSKITPTQMAKIIRDAAFITGITEEEILTLACIESSLQHDAESKKGAYGLLQLKRGTAKEQLSRLGLNWNPNLMNPRHSALIGASYLQYLLSKRGGDMSSAIQDYNTGPYSRNYRARTRYLAKFSRKQGVINEIFSDSTF